MSSKTEKRAYSPREFAAVYGVPLRTVYDLIATGEVEAKVRNAASERPRYVIPAAAAEAWFSTLAAA